MTSGDSGKYDHIQGVSSTDGWLRFSAAACCQAASPLRKTTMTGKCEVTNWENLRAHGRLYYSTYVAPDDACASVDRRAWATLCGAAAELAGGSCRTACDRTADEHSRARDRVCAASAFHDWWCVLCAQIPTASTKVVLADTVDIAPVAVGCWSWGDRPTWKWTPESEADDMDAFRTAIRSGINLFDTAEKYGNGESERLLGRFIARDKVRDKVAIATKFLPLPGKTNYSEVLLDALKNSLQRLGVDFVELYQVHPACAPECPALTRSCPVQVHGPIHQVSLNTIADALAEAVRQGWTKTVGVSNYSVEEMMTVYERLRDEHGIQLATNQVEFSLTRTLPLENGMVDACRDAGIVLLAYSPLGMGRLTGKYSASNPPPSGRRFSDYKMEELEPLLDTMRRIAQHHAVPVPAVALNWVMSKGTRG